MSIYGTITKWVHNKSILYKSFDYTGLTFVGNLHNIDVAFISFREFK